MKQGSACLSSPEARMFVLEAMSLVLLRSVEALSMGSRLLHGLSSHEVIFFFVLYEEKMASEGLELRFFSDQSLERANRVLKMQTHNGRKAGERSWLYQKMAGFLGRGILQELVSGERQADDVATRAPLLEVASTGKVCQFCDEVATEDEETLCVLCVSGEVGNILRTGTPYPDGDREEAVLDSSSEEEEEEGEEEE